MGKERQQANGGRGNFTLRVPLDVTAIEDFDAEQTLRVAARDAAGAVSSAQADVDRKGGSATLTFAERPGTLQVAVGPADASDEDLFSLQTIRLDLPASRWSAGPELAIPPVRIPPFYWFWWRRWCRRFVIRGRVLCPDGSPAPGATVCAFDVDWWWWWSSKQQVACATTDATGSFQMVYRWCCGWWPWWWWARRYWILEPGLVELITPVLQQDPHLARLLRPSPNPDIALFDPLLSGDVASPLMLQHGMQQPAHATAAVGLGPSMVAAAGGRSEFDPSALEGLRERLLKRLPRVPQLEQLRVWPWWPWRPWWDCTPDIVFKVTQNCQGQDRVLLDEGFSAARWDAPSPLDVTLVVSDRACCIPHCRDPRECPQGICVVISHACGVSVSNIGGNPGAAPAPSGYANLPPGAAFREDRPFAGVVPVSGVIGDAANVDYYDFQWATSATGPWSPLPPPSFGGVTRQYWGPQLGGGPVGFYSIHFPVTPLSGQNVIESREHFEANNDPGSWGLTRFWTSGLNVLMNWQTENIIPDGTYFLRLRAWNLVGVALTNERILPLCDTDKDNGLVLTLDNRPLPGPGSGHVPPLTPGHRCGDDTVHTCTLEPDTDFLQVRLNGVPVNACQNVDAREGGSLTIDFMAHDPDGHLAYYSLIATYSENLAVDLLSVPGATLTPWAGPPAPPVLAAAQVGPTYGAALAAGATRPIWHGGAIRLTIPNLRLAFPESCCYQLELRAYKRTIVNCDGGLVHANLSEFSLGVVV